MNRSRLSITSALLSCWIAAIAAPVNARAAVSTPAAPGTQATPLAETIRTLFAVHRFEQAAISPDAGTVAWVESVDGKDGASTGLSMIYVAAAAGKGKARRITAGSGASAHAEGTVAWSPDGRQLAFLSDASKPGQSQVYVIDVDAAGSAAKKLTSVQGFLASPGWSPDGTTIAVLFTANATRAAGPLVPFTPQTGVVEDTITEQRLALVDAASGGLREISPADMYIYEYDWSPDGRRFITTAAHGSGDDNWYLAELHTIDAATGQTKSIYKPPLQIANPRWSPDGRKVAFIAGLMSDEDVIGNDVFVCDADGGSVQNLTPNMNGSTSWLAWAKDGKHLMTAGYVEGESGIAALDIAAHDITPIWKGPESISSSDRGMTLSVAADGGSTAVIRDSFSDAPEVWSGPPGAWKQITSRNAALAPMWGEAKSIHWKSDAYDIQGWLLYPHDFDPSRKYPLVVSVHGGPASMLKSHWPGRGDRAAALAGAGYFALYPNPRGSFGHGESFVRANVKDFGYGDFRDIMAGVDETLRIAPVDPARMGITGWSYGGYMTMWAVTQTNRFRAAVAGAGIANYQSYYGQNRIDQWMLGYFGATVYDDPAVYLKSSPITFIKQTKTPTLIIVGDGDAECPPPQSFEFWHALKTLGVETRLVVYPHEGHRFRDPAHQRDIIERTADWFESHLK